MLKLELLRCKNGEKAWEKLRKLETLKNGIRALRSTPMSMRMFLFVTGVINLRYKSRSIVCKFTIFIITYSPSFSVFLEN